ncbi:MAG: hypothetical protein M3Z25_05910 [Actinomycetota bacterium]|nr:hypothetical protein [Actinomycetota bacterium]
MGCTDPSSTCSGTRWWYRWAGPVLAALFTITATLHFVVPGVFDALVPAALPGGPRFWTLASGMAELAVAVAIAAPRTRRFGGGAAVVLLLAVLPGNIKMAIDWSDRSLPEQLVAYARLPMQIPLILWALRVRRTAVFR